jgi:hypothetical protein
VADSKISALTALAAADVASASDLLAIVDTSAVATKSISVQALHGAAQVVSTKTTGSPYSLVATDAGTLLVIDSSTAYTVTIANVLQPGQRVDILRVGTGSVTLQAGAGVTLSGTPGLLLRAQFSAASVICRSSGVCVAVGDLTA